ncbi:hypothetical protein DAPPUDRAFT_238907 [Daphnia pulex]|uniref:Uncharacterized protein n=1 Tax=Daphnia pulex TaxID=6669 RepID=E9G7R8_DAPPU|nr:hypothetical protein DAPPUDRAFT_238907 [Daphnia pulex]|eukprot:EFX84527.1 hypothetical protein DAPPUDRAFT_238907 [Daphnia pulex]
MEPHGTRAQCEESGGVVKACHGGTASRDSACDQGGDGVDEPPAASHCVP